MSNKLKKPLLLTGMFVLIMVLSAVASSYITARNRDSKVALKTLVASVDLFDKKVTPETLSIKVGETIVVNNKSSTPRELSLGAGHALESSAHDDAATDTSHGHKTETAHDHLSAFSSGSIGIDEAWQATFNEVGTYFLHDHENPDVNILVVVYSSESPSIPQ